MSRLSALQSRGDVATPTPFKRRADLGIGAGDVLDAIFVDHLGLVRFSLAAPTATASPADILEPKPSGGVAVYAAAAQLGLDATRDDVDALDIEACRFTARESFSIKNGGYVGPGTYVEVASTQPTARVTLGRGSRAEDGSVLVGPTVRLGAGTRVAGVVTNNLQAAPTATVAGVQRPATGILPLPLDLSARVPAACDKVNPVRRNDIDLANGAARLTLASGVYGDVTVGNGATLIIGPGSYSFCSLVLGRGARVEIRGGVATHLAIIRDLRLGNASRFEPLVGTPPPQVEVGGTSLRVGADGVLLAFVRAPEARAILGRAFTFRGSLLARSVRSDHSGRLGCVEAIGPTP